MKLDWKKYYGFEVSVILTENYGVIANQSLDKPFYEVSYKTGYLKEAFEEGIVIFGEFQGRTVDTFIPYFSIKCVDILYPESERTN